MTHNPGPLASLNSCTSSACVLGTASWSASWRFHQGRKLHYLPACLSIQKARIGQFLMLDEKEHIPPFCTCMTDIYSSYSAMVRTSCVARVVHTVALMLQNKLGQLHTVNQLIFYIIWLSFVSDHYQYYLTVNSREAKNPLLSIKRTPYKHKRLLHEKPWCVFSPEAFFFIPWVL